MSEIAELAKLELHLSHAPTVKENGSAINGSRLEAYFSEINYSTFSNGNASWAPCDGPRPRV